VIPYGRQSIDDDDIAAVVAVLKGDWLTQGPHIAEFEEALAARVEARQAVVFSSGTAALHAAAAAAGLGPGDLVVTSPLTFAASANCVRYVGGSVSFVDIDPATLNMNLATVPPEADGVVVVHYAGLPTDLGTLGRRPGVVIEDAAHALGATTPDGPVGNCARSDMCVFSFHPVKVVTAGEGGVVTTNEATLVERLRRFRNHGMTPRPDLGPWYYEIETLGYNYRMTDIQAALGTSQLGKLDRFVGSRQALAARYERLLAGTSVVLPPRAGDGSTHAYHLFPVRVPERARVFAGMRDAGIGVQTHYVPVYRHPAYAAPGADPGQFPHTEAAYAGLLSLPLYPDLTQADQDRVVEALVGLL
jgi:UDP-4-amino-4,6-dideoxy-N-acetyl-beta-L-altrosamine transaminase